MQKHFRNIDDKSNNNLVMNKILWITEDFTFQFLLYTS